MNSSTYCNSNSGSAPPSTCVFYDIRTGDNVVPCQPTTPNCYVAGQEQTYGVLTTGGTGQENIPAYAAAEHWDFTTGIGSMNVTNVINAWQPN